MIECSVHVALSRRLCCGAAWPQV